jgi:hypothetical protein
MPQAIFLSKKVKNISTILQSFDWGSAGVATLAGFVGGILGSMLYEKSQMNKSTASLGQLSFQIQQMSNELNNLKSNPQYQPPFNSTPNGNTAAGINLNNTNNNQPPTFDEFGNKIS